jgi:hypothetical protein
VIVHVNASSSAVSEASAEASAEATAQATAIAHAHAELVGQIETALNQRRSWTLRPVTCKHTLNLLRPALSRFQNRMAILTTVGLRLNMLLKL